MALLAGSEIKQTRKNIAAARAELGNTVQALAQRLDVKSRVAHGTRQRTQQAVDFGKRNQIGVTAVAAGVVIAVGLLVVWRRFR